MTKHVPNLFYMTECVSHPFLTISNISKYMYVPLNTSKTYYIMYIWTLSETHSEHDVLWLSRSETHSLKSPAQTVRLFLVRGQMRSEACLVEIDPEVSPPHLRNLHLRTCTYMYYRNQDLHTYMYRNQCGVFCLQDVQYVKLLQSVLKQSDDLPFRFCWP